jgi:hypothetical protein
METGEYSSQLGIEIQSKPNQNPIISCRYICYDVIKYLNIHIIVVRRDKTMQHQKTASRRARSKLWRNALIVYFLVSKFDAEHVKTEHNLLITREKRYKVKHVTCRVRAQLKTTP